MKTKIKKAFWVEVSKGNLLYQNKDYDLAFSHYERSHILGQSSPFFHTYSHICMLKVGFAKRDLKEILGQIFRIPSGFVGSVFGVYPHGNTGGSNVSAFKKMKVPKDLEEVLSK